MFQYILIFGGMYLLFNHLKAFSEVLPESEGNKDVKTKFLNKKSSGSATQAKTAPKEMKVKGWYKPKQIDTYTRDDYGDNRYRTTDDIDIQALEASEGKPPGTYAKDVEYFGPNKDVTNGYPLMQTLQPLHPFAREMTNKSIVEKPISEV
jgi:hypothetical protein